MTCQNLPGKSSSSKLSTHSFISNLRRDNEIITSDEEKANKFLNSFSKSLTANNELNSAIPGIRYCDPTAFTLTSINKYLKLVNLASAVGLKVLKNSFAFSSLEIITSLSLYSLNLEKS